MTTTGRITAAAFFAFAAPSARAQSDNESNTVSEHADFTQSLGVSATNTTTSEYHSNNRNGMTLDDDYGVVINRLNVVGTGPDLSAFARIDAFAFRKRPTATRRDGVEVERLALRYEHAGLTLTGGDFYEQLGRGILLSIRKMDENGVDLALRGGSVEYQSKHQRATVFAGQANTANVDSVSQQFVKDTHDTLAGARYELLPIAGARIGVHGVYLEPKERLLDALDKTVSGGAYVELPQLFGLVSLYLEADRQQRVLAGVPDVGNAAYGTLDIPIGDTSCLIEGLYLDKVEQMGSQNSATGVRFAYNRPPTLERIQEEVANNRDVVGGRLRVEHSLADSDVLLFVNGTARLNDFKSESDAPVRQLHGQGGAEMVLRDGNTRLNLSAGYRDESQLGRSIKSMVHGDLDYSEILRGPLSLHAASSTEVRNAEGSGRYVRGSTFVGMHRAGAGEVTFELGYDTQVPTAGVRKLFYAGIVAWELIEAIQLRATAGTQRGGIKCVAGVCREYPAFAGVRGELIARYAL